MTAIISTNPLIESGKTITKNAIKQKYINFFKIFIVCWES